MSSRNLFTLVFVESSSTIIEDKEFKSTLSMINPLGLHAFLLFPK